MLYLLILSFTVGVDDVAQGTLSLLTPDDLEELKYQTEFCTNIDSDLDNLVLALDPDIVAPTTANGYIVAKDFKYHLKYTVADNIELASILSLFNLLTIA